MCADREGGIKGGGYVCALGLTVSHVRGAGFRGGGGLNLVFPGDPPLLIR